VTLAELEAATEQVEVVKTMVCAFGLTSTALWTGVPLRVLLARAGVDRARVARARFFGRDGFENNLPIAAIFDNQAAFEPLLAFRLYQDRLPFEHGFPFRLLLADRYGYKNIKWLERIELTDRDEPTGQYQTRGYSDAGLIEPQVMTAGVRVTERLPVGPITLCGFAVSGYAGIEAVELTVDDGPSSAATLTSVQELAQQVPELARTVQLQHASSVTQTDVPSLWSAWSATLQVTAGEHRVRIRVRDRSGREADATDLRLIGLA
jgi:DMSO/TMAO reductase YedYZ molybdopterin-dependent catalytic subunit